MESQENETQDDEDNIGNENKYKNKKWISLAILVFANLLNVMDRYTVSGLLNAFSEEMCDSSPPPEDGKEERCSTSQEGLIQTAFIMVVTLTAPMVGYLGDRHSRKVILTISILLWGGFSLAASFMPGYWSFLIVRSAIAIGSSAFSIVAPTVLGDLFDEKTRSFVFGIFYIVIPLGAGLGFVVGGAPSDWRTGLRITPGFTLLSAVLTFILLVDPPRGEIKTRKRSHNKTSYCEDITYIAGVKSFALNCAAFTCFSFFGGSLTWFAPVYFSLGIHSHNITCQGDPDYVSVISVSQVSSVFGAIVCASGLLGVVGGSRLSRYLRPKFQWIDPVICGSGLLIALPLLITGVLLARDRLILSFIVLFLGLFFLNFIWPVSSVMTIYLIRPGQRSTAQSLYAAISNGLGSAVSPYLVGLLASGLRERVTSSHPEYCEDMVSFICLQYAMALPFILLLCGGVFFLVSGLLVVGDIKAVENYQPDNVEERSPLHRQISVISRM